MKGPAFFAYADNYLIDTEHAIIVDVEATRAVGQAETGGARTMSDRTMDRFGLWPEKGRGLVPERGSYKPPSREDLARIRRAG